MENPIKYSDFIRPDSSVSDLIKQLEEVQKTYSAMIDKIRTEAGRLEKILKKVNAATGQGKDETQKAAEAAEKLAKEYEKLAQSQTEAAKELARLKAEQQKQNQINKLTEKLNSSLEGSYDRLSAQYSLNKIRLNAMSAEERKATQTGVDLEAQTAAIYEEMKRLQEATGKYTLDVGNYEKATKGLKEELADLKDQLGQVPGATGAAANGLQGLAQGAKAFLANPLVLVISLIVGGLAALFQAFKRTQGGADLLAKGSAALSGIFSAFIGVVDKGAKIVARFFEDPVQGIKDLGSAIVQNLVNRLKGLLDIFRAVGKGFEGLVNRDLGQLKEAAGDAGRALLQMGTGLDTKQQKEFGAAIAETTRQIKEQALAFAALEEARQKTRRANREIEKSIQPLITQEELLRATADDATKSFAEREEAAQKAAALTVQRSSLEQQIAASNLQLINRELDLRQANGEAVEDLLDQQLNAYKTLAEAQRAYLLTVRDNQKRESELIQDRLERDLDILIDGVDNQKTINERIIADESRTFSERQAKLEETRALFDSSFAKQIETIQKFTGAQVDANELINESDAVVLNQKIRSLGLSEIIEGRLLEIVRDRRTGLQDLAEAEQDLANKRAKADEEAAKKAKEETDKRYKNSLAVIEQENELRLSEIDLLKATEAEKTRLRLQAERDRLQKILDLNQTAEGQLSALQIAAIKNTIAKINNELDAADQGGRDIYSIVGLKLDDEEKQGISQAVGAIQNGLQNILQARVDYTDKILEKTRQEKEGIQARLDAEIQARQEGFANNVANVQNELELNRQREEALLKEKEKAQKAQAALDTVTQTSSLITASANLWASLSPIPIVGPILAAAAIGTMFASFAASKIKAKNVAKEEFAEGGYEVLAGGSHASGNDIPLGINSKGRERRAEGGEGMAIFSRKSTSKYRSILPKLVDSINAGTFEQTFVKQLPIYQDGANVFVEPTNTKRMEKELTAIRKNSENRIYTDGKGRLVKQYKNLTTIYAS